MEDRKDTKGKHNPLLLPIEADKAFSIVSDYGLKKYGNRDTWMHNEPETGVTKYLEGCIRHAKAYYQNGQLDPESGIPHVYAALWNAAVACWHYERLDVEQKPEWDHSFCITSEKATVEIKFNGDIAEARNITDSHFYTIQTE